MMNLGGHGIIPRWNQKFLDYEIETEQSANASYACFKVGIKSFSITRLKRDYLFSLCKRAVKLESKVSRLRD